jgi:hypothetical protein
MTEDAKEASQQNPVDILVDQLNRRMVPDPDRARLGKALDIANGPDKSRAGQDAAVNRAFR